MVEVGNKEYITLCAETTRNSIGNFSASGRYLGYEVVMSDFNENPLSLKSRVPIAGGMQRDVMDEGVYMYRFTLTWIVTDFRHLKFFASGITNSGSNPYTHTINLENSKSSNFFSLQRVQDSGSVFTYLGCTFLRTRYEWQKSTGDDNAGYLKAVGTVIATSMNTTTSAQSISDSTTREPFTFNEFKATIDGTEKIEVISGSIEIDSGINPEDFFYCSATNDKYIGEVRPVFFKTVGNLTYAVKDDSLITEMIDGISGTTKFEFIKNSSSNKIAFNLSKVYNLMPFSTTNFRGVNQANVVYDATISSIVIVDGVSSY